MVFVRVPKLENLKFYSRDYNTGGSSEMEFGMRGSNDYSGLIVLSFERAEGGSCPYIALGDQVTEEKRWRGYFGLPFHTTPPSILICLGLEGPSPLCL